MMTGRHWQGQQNPHDCVLCSLAMFLNRPYDEVKRRAVDVCSRTLITWTPDEPMPTSLMRLVAFDYRRTVVTMQEFPPATRVMLTLASTRADWLHVVCLSEGGLVFDPAREEILPFDPTYHLFAEAHVGLRHLAPWVLREMPPLEVAAWPEIELRAQRATTQRAA